MENIEIQSLTVLKTKPTMDKKIHRVIFLLNSRNNDKMKNVELCQPPFIPTYEKRLPPLMCGSSNLNGMKNRRRSIHSHNIPDDGKGIPIQCTENVANFRYTPDPIETD